MEGKSNYDFELCIHVFDKITETQYEKNGFKNNIRKSPFILVFLWLNLYKLCHASVSYNSNLSFQRIRYFIRC